MARICKPLRSTPLTLSTTREIASRFAVRGYVHNMPDRSVELVVEGTPSEIDAFIKAIREQMVDFIREMTSSERPAANQFEGFTVRH